MTVLFQDKFHENRFQRLWWVQNEAPCHGLLAVCGRLNQLSQDRVLSLHNNTEWSVRSSDLIPCDFFSLGLFKRQAFQNSSRKFECPTANNDN